MNKPADCWEYWPVVQQPLEVLKKGILVLVDETHHRVAGKKDLEHSETFVSKLFQHTQKGAFKLPCLMEDFKWEYLNPKPRKWQEGGGRLICHSISDF